MDELRGPNIQIILHVREGLGFGFLRSPFIVSGSLNGYMLETDPVVPTHAPAFDAELVWEADKRKFRSLRVQNVPIKVEVFTVGTQGRKDKVGYMLLSLLAAQPCPSNKIVDVKYAWHKLLGVKSEGKCCHPQLMLSLTVQDRLNTLTPRNELRMFHSNEVAYPTTDHTHNPVETKHMLMTYEEYIAESNRTVSAPELQPKLLCDEGLIQIGGAIDQFVLSFVIGSVEHLDLLAPENSDIKEMECCVAYSVFTHNIMTDRVKVSSSSGSISACVNQRTSLRLATSLRTLSQYLAACPLLVVRVCAADITAPQRDIGVCSVDLRKLVPTEDPALFLGQFCNGPRSLRVHERCFVQRGPDPRPAPGPRRPYLDVEMTLQYIGVKESVKPSTLSARSAAQLARGASPPPVPIRSGSDTHIHTDVGGVAYTNITPQNTHRYKNAAGDALLQTNEITDLLKKMCDSLALSQRVTSHSDMQVQCGQTRVDSGTNTRLVPPDNVLDSEPVKLETSKSETHIQGHKDTAKESLPSADRSEIIQKYVDELEDWKEKQQELFKYQLKRKEEYHLELLSKEWNKKRHELETKLSRGIEQCRHLAADLSRATDDFRLRGYRNTEREKHLHEAKKALEAHYTSKYQQLREASQQMEDDMNHQLKMKDMLIEEKELKITQLEKQIEVLKNNALNAEQEAQSKYSGLTKDQTASLIQELRSLEEKLQSAVQAKQFFKEQWARGVRELHLARLTQRRQLLDHITHHRRHLTTELDTIEDSDENKKSDPVDIQKLKDDFYVELLVNTPGLDSNAIPGSGPDGLDMFDAKEAAKNPTIERINELVTKRDRLIEQNEPDEHTLAQLNTEIRTLLLNCAT